MLKFIFGTIALLLTVLIATSLFFGMRQHKSFTASAEAFIEDAIEPVMRTWDLDQFQRMLTTSLYVSSNKEELQKLLVSFQQQLGPLTEISNKTLSVYGKRVSGLTFRIVANFMLTAHFSNGDGLVVGSLEYEGDHWALSEFFVDSKLLREGASP